MKELIKQLLREELFSAYHRRYLFDVDKAYALIKNNGVKFEVKKYSPLFLRSFSHPEFSFTDPKKLSKLKKSLDLTAPLGILVNFRDPESKKTEWILIDGNHRVRAAADNKSYASLYVIPDPADVKKFMKVNKDKEHKLFIDY